MSGDTSGPITSRERCRRLRSSRRRHQATVAAEAGKLYQRAQLVETGTLDGALLSGRKAAEALLADH